MSQRNLAIQVWNAHHGEHVCAYKINRHGTGECPGDLTLAEWLEDNGLLNTSQTTEEGTIPLEIDIVNHNRLERPKSIRELREAGALPTVEGIDPETLYRKHKNAEWPCPNGDCPGDARYAAPGRGHNEGCQYPMGSTPRKREDAPRLNAEGSAVEETLDYFKDRLDEIMTSLNDLHEKVDRAGRKVESDWNFGDVLESANGFRYMQVAEDRWVNQFGSHVTKLPDDTELVLGR